MPSTDENDWMEAQRRVGRELGLEFVGAGRLTEDWGGHARGTPFLTLRAETSMDRSRARDLLDDIARINDLMWCHGWQGRRLAGGRLVAELRVFPDALGAPSLP